MTTVYFVRHAEPDYSNHDDMERPLTSKGKEDSKLVTYYLSDKNIDIVLSSPFSRAIETVRDFAESFGHSIITVEDFRERKVDSVWIDDFNKFSEIQWGDFDYKLSDGECLREVQNRNIDALMQVLRKFRDKNIVIGSHGTALSTIINYFDPAYGFEDFQNMRYLMPWIVKLSFQGENLIDIKKVDVFSLRRIRRAVGAILVAPDNKCLLVHKANICDAKNGKIDVSSWDFIKGGIRENETKLDAIKREITEETGIDKFVVMEELSEKICFEFSSSRKRRIGYDGQETTMYIVQLNDQPSGLRCDDDEVDGYTFVNKGSVLDKLSQEETREFWINVIKKL